MIGRLGRFGPRTGPPRCLRLRVVRASAQATPGRIGSPTRWGPPAPQYPNILNRASRGRFDKGDPPTSLKPVPRYRRESRGKPRQPQGECRFPRRGG